MKCSKQLQKRVFLSKRTLSSLTVCIAHFSHATEFPYLISTKSIQNTLVALPRQWLVGEKVSVSTYLIYTIACDLRTCKENTKLTNDEVKNNIVELRDSYPWADLKGTVVDVGGGSGHTSIELARVSLNHLLAARSSKV